MDSWGSIVTPTHSQLVAAAAAKKEKQENKKTNITKSRKVQTDLLRVASSLSLRFSL